MTRWVIAIDPGPVKSAYVIWHPTEGFFSNAESGLEPFGKIDNERLNNLIEEWQKIDCDPVIETITLYQPADVNIHDTILFSGRFFESFVRAKLYPRLLSRQKVKLSLLPGLSGKYANDATVKRSLIDRFAPNTSNHGKGTKKDPGYFYGFAADVWQAFALAVAHSDLASFNPDDKTNTPF